MKVNISEISRISGFSPATVSNALNNKKGVSRETADKIFHVAQECGYQPKAKISSIKFVVYRNSGLVVSDTPFFSSLIAGVESESRSSGYETAIFNLDKNSPDYEKNLNLLMTDSRSAILLLATELSEEEAPVFQKVSSPLVILDSWFENSLFNSVLINNTDSVNHAVQYLIRKGHRKIGYLQSSVRIQNFIYRQMGYQRAMLDSGLQPDSKLTFSLTPTMDGAYNDMDRLLRQHPEMPTAFMADNDIIALGAMKALQGHGYRIPDDISLIGFDDLQFCSISTPPLTSIHVFKQDMGKIAVRRLIELIDSGTQVKTKIQICNEFVERASVRQME
ncbi:MAG TPA: LacI family transcriptional regulator [Clostridiales bacterium]|nr:LacI family transcriptional regulator [Clostridiales bacterium]